MRAMEQARRQRHLAAMKEEKDATFAEDLVVAMEDTWHKEYLAWTILLVMHLLKIRGQEVLADNLIGGGFRNPSARSLRMYRNNGKFWMSIMYKKSSEPMGRHAYLMGRVGNTASPRAVPFNFDKDGELWISKNPYDVVDAISYRDLSYRQLYIMADNMCKLLVRGNEVVQRLTTFNAWAYYNAARAYNDGEYDLTEHFADFGGPYPVGSLITYVSLVLVRPTRDEVVMAVKNPLPWENVR